MFNPDASAQPESQKNLSNQLDNLNQAFLVKFWGVRGHVPTPGADTVRYGGNTACVEVNVGGQQLIFDGGTGLRALGHHLVQKATRVDAHLFFTHTHWDRIQGFPFFCPAFDRATRLNIYGAVAENGASIKHSLTTQMLRPNFFTPLQTMEAELIFHSIQAGEMIQLGDVTVETLSLSPQTHGLGYRVTWQDHALVYATGTDPTQSAADPNLVRLAHGADVVIFDGTYVDMAYADPDNNLLTPWELGIKVAQAGQVGQLVLFHHHPRHPDDYLDQLEQQVQATFARVCLAREGMTLRII